MVTGKLEYVASMQSTQNYICITWIDSHKTMDSQYTENSDI